MEITTAIKKLKNNKAAGSDGISPEVFKHCIEPLTSLENLLKLIWRQRTIPEEWKRSLIASLHKKGNKSKISNYRGISLLNIGLKSWKQFSKAGSSLHVKVARKNQAFFKRNKGCRDQIFTKRQLAQQRYQYNQQTVLAFIDLKAAFDSVDRNVIWNILENHGLPGNICCLTKMYVYRNS